MSLARFFVNHIPDRGLVHLDESESHHAARVLRVQIGEDCLIFDGQGYEGFGTIESIHKREVTIAISGKRFAPRDHSGNLCFAIAMPKGDRQRSVIEKLVELGVDRLLPIDSHRSVAKLDDDSIAKLHRYNLEACKQCQRNRLMQIDPPSTLRSLFTNIDSKSLTDRWILHPGIEGSTLSEFLESHMKPRDTADKQETAQDPSAFERPRGILFAVGPEGGFTTEEIEQSGLHGFKRLHLGERILRVETAVASAATLGSAVLGIGNSSARSHRAHS
ncbi:MAG: 16S rRNA (uracil(1498)-N(3))-methyltransferase [Planctomycetes bacterium]|nr:16S rRNA (uracil(1498)-N(3))-methyltransferase [Planctomycetota bacterium]